jgi:hypothetical protein
MFVVLRYALSSSLRTRTDISLSEPITPTGLSDEKGWKRGETNRGTLEKLPFHYTLTT